MANLKDSPTLLLPLDGRQRHGPPTLLDLSDCVLLYLFQYLDGKSLFYLSLTCGRLSTVCADPILWRTVDLCHPPHTEALLHYCFERTHENTVEVRCRGTQPHKHLLPRVFFTQVSSWHHLCVLSLEQQTLYGATFTLFSLPAGLQELSLRRTTVIMNASSTQRSLFHMSNCALKQLKVLCLDDCDWLRTSDLMSISKYEQLEVLSVVSCRHLDNSIPYLSLTRFGFTKLKVLDARITGLGNNILSVLSNSKSVLAIYLQRDFTRRLQQFRCTRRRARYEMMATATPSGSADRGRALRRRLRRQIVENIEWYYNRGDRHPLAALHRHWPNNEPPPLALQNIVEQVYNNNDDDDDSLNGAADPLPSPPLRLPPSLNAPLYPGRPPHNCHINMIPQNCVDDTGMFDFKWRRTCPREVVGATTATTSQLARPLLYKDPYLTHGCACHQHDDDDDDTKWWGGGGDDGDDDDDDNRDTDVNDSSSDNEYVCQEEAGLNNTPPSPPKFRNATASVLCPEADAREGSSSANCSHNATHRNSVSNNNYVGGGGLATNRNCEANNSSLDSSNGSATSSTRKRSHSVESPPPTTATALTLKRSRLDQNGIHDDAVINVGAGPSSAPTTAAPTTQDQQRTIFVVELRNNRPVTTRINIQDNPFLPPQPPPPIPPPLPPPPAPSVLVSPPPRPVVGDEPVALMLAHAAPEVVVRAEGGQPPPLDECAHIPLRRLSLRGFRHISDRTIDYLQNVDLDVLDVSYTRVTRAALLRYHQLHPACRIIGPAFCTCAMHDPRMCL